MMKKLFLILSLMVISLSWAGQTPSVEVAKSWLGGIDAGQYEQSWDEAGALFQEQVTKDQWRDIIKAVRSPLGRVISRAELGRQNFTSLPGAPEGEYLVVQFQTEFANKAGAVETLTLSKTNDKWQPVGYFIK
ncbi:DUF4019 domain-containing protein [Pseudoalteromonas sp. T1lg48]|uniref:DUF4019 domain-containing protein n=1 Tax=Pseudoalteromonas sp. T1lg48 TaxID=2077100 RepID=UPI001F2F551C|nr:DUF4019 domain-containing protein [Pseudoalteromonas sp. T1lg48]